ncbi:MAG: hypothetical protein NTZ24_16860 [Deltaproteobacteria bacterium]|nr:hypothetical protein [Deltaproteobacteria bacterium]
MNKRILFLFLTLLFAFVSTEGYCGTILTNVTARTVITPSGQIEIKYEITNTGDDTAYHVTVTTFIALEVSKSDDLGSNPPGGLLRYDCILTPDGLTPGKYTLVTRINFNEQGGALHRVYLFTPLRYRLDRAGESQPDISVDLTEPHMNVKSFWQSDGKCKLSLKNNLGVSIRPVVTLYLPDGFMTSEPERSYELAAGEKKEVVVPLEMDSSVRETLPVYVVAWYEHNGIHTSLWIERKIIVEQRPVYFKAFLIITGMALAIILIVVFYRRRGDRKSQL